MVPLASRSRFRNRKEAQWDRPMVWDPDRTTISSAVRVLARNPSMRSVAVLLGPGRLFRASSSVETLPSRRPAGTW
uniref:Uncharacterized protein n=1 Tax=Arundo donax TaxID=35708 RepID=A0A0A8ZT91_ARUDO